MRLRRSQPALTQCWPEPINRMLNDKTTGGDRDCSHDHFARPGAVMAISDCRYLRSDLACTGGNRPSTRKKRIKTQPGDTSPCDGALHPQHWYLRSATLSCRPAIDRRASRVSPNHIGAESLGVTRRPGRRLVP